jgi:uncharacterized protein YndB with AHSA1/START domain
VATTARRDAVNLCMPRSSPIVGGVIVLSDDWNVVANHYLTNADTAPAYPCGATPERVWRAITDGDDTAGYYYGTRVRSTWEVGAAIAYDYPDGSLAADGIVLEVEPGRRVVMAFHPRWDPGIEAEGPVRMTWAIEAGQDGGPTRLTVTSALVPGSRAADEFSGGVVHIVSGLKTLLETGTPLAVA